MDESHRLKEMKPGYDERLFEKLLKECTPLIKKLAYNIDNRRFGVDKDEVESWFRVKFTYAFNKYFDTEPERLKGYIISSLQMYSTRVISNSYKPEFVDHASQIDITELYDETLIDSDDDSDPMAHEYYLQLAIDYLKKNISPDALLILELELNPPKWIHRELEDLEKKPNAKIPHAIIAEYLGLPEGGDQYVRHLRDTEIYPAVEAAREHFKNLKLSGVKLSSSQTQ